MNRRLAALEKEKAAVISEMEKMLSASDGQSLSDDDESQYTELESRLDGLNKKIGMERRLEEAQLDAPTIPADNLDTPEGREARIGNAKPAWHDDPKGGFKTDREFLQCVLVAGKTGNRKVDDRLKPLRVEGAAGSDEHQTQSDPYGGFLVPEAFAPDILSLEPEPDPIEGRTMRIPMESPVVKVPARVDKNHTTSVSGGLTVTRREETGTFASSRMELEQVRLEAHSLFGLSYVSEELLSDSPRSVAALLSAGFRDQFTSHMIDERLNGTGVGQYEGVLNSPALISVAKEGSQAADTILGRNIIKMRSRCWRYERAIWLANHDTYPQLAEAHVESPNNAGIIKLYQQSLQEDRPDRLNGRPIFYTEYAKTLGDQGDLILAVFSEFLEGVYEPLQNASSVHVRFLNHERTFKFWLRNAGASWWRSALTPKNSSTTLSPFVVLDERG